MQLRSFLRGLAIMHAKCIELRAIHDYLWMTNTYQTGVRLREEHNRCAVLINRLRRRHFPQRFTHHTHRVP